MQNRSPKLRFRHRLTRLGFHFLFVALFAMIGGSLRGFNLLLMLSGLLVGVVLIQWRVGRANIRLARVERVKVAGAHAGSSLVIRYRVRNVSRWLPLWMIRVQGNVHPPTAEGERIDWMADGEEETAELVCSVGYVEPKGQASTSVLCRFHHRGRYLLGPSQLSSTFPFSLMQSDLLSATVSEPVYIYPRLLKLKKGWQSLLPPRRGGDGSRSTGGTNHDGDFFGLRPWQSGDQVKHIHWRTTARVGDPAVRQFEQRNRHQVCFVVDGCSIAEEESFELLLQVAATLTKETSSQTASVSLIVLDQSANQTANQPDDQSVLLSDGADLKRLMQRLAIAQAKSNVLEKADTAHVERFNQGIAEAAAAFRKYDVVVLSTRTLKQGLSGALNHPAGPVLRHLDRTGKLAWIDVTSQSTLQYIAHGDHPIAKTEVHDGVR